jgi:hypothetical protein
MDQSERIITLRVYDDALSIVEACKDKEEIIRHIRARKQKIVDELITNDEPYSIFGWWRRRWL